MVVPTECGDHQRQTERRLTSCSPKCVFARAHKLTSSIRDYQFLLDSVSSSVPQGACSALIQATSAEPPIGSPQRAQLLPRLERKYRSELIAPVVRLGHPHSLEELGARGGGTCVDVAGFLYERNPFVQFVSECSRVEVGAGQAIAPPGLGRIGAVRTILQMQDPSGIVPFRIGLNDTREREAQFPEG